MGSPELPDFGTHPRWPGVQSPAGLHYQWEEPLEPGPANCSPQFWELSKYDVQSRAAIAAEEGLGRLCPCITGADASVARSSFSMVQMEGSGERALSVGGGGLYPCDSFLSRGKVP